jgi:hypothetical protein
MGIFLSRGGFPCQKLYKFTDVGPGGRQYFCDALRGWPTRLPFFGPSLAAIERCGVQTALPRKARTRHIVFTGKPLYGGPDFIVFHFLSPWTGIFGIY